MTAILLTPSLWANWNDTATGIDLNKLPHPVLTRVYTGPLRAGHRATFDGIIATVEPTEGSWDQIVLRSRAKSGKTWTVRICNACLSEVWRADLDGNGTLDYVIFGSGPYRNGRNAPLYSLSFLLMDPNGLPVPFFTVVYHGENGYGIKTLVSSSGRTQLLISNYDEAKSDLRAGPFCSGHWTTQLYEFRKTVVEELRGKYNGIDFPFVHKWSYVGTECQPKAGGPTEAPQLIVRGTSRNASVTTRLIGSELAIEPVSGCKTASAFVMIIDTVASREIAFPIQYSTVQQRLADRIKVANAPIELRGIDRRDQLCAATLLWARLP